MRGKLLILLTLTLNLSHGQADLIKELNKNLIEIEPISPDSSFDELEILLPILKQKKIIGLGEATHGTKEFFVYKHKVIKYLITEADFKVFIIEGDFTGSQIMNDYVLYGKGELKDALIGVGYGIWMTEEFIDLINWIKEYNSTQSYDNKIKFYGCEIINGGITAKKVKDYLKKGNKSTKVTEQGLNWIIERKYTEKYSKDEEKLVRKAMAELDQILESQNNKTDHSYQIIKQEITLLGQFVEMRFSTSSYKLSLRDKFMSENIDWIFSHENNGKTMFWAHNEHVANNNGKKEQKPVGYYLKHSYAEAYYSLGFGFYKGKITTYDASKGKWVINQVPDVSIKKSTDAIFKQCDYSNFILDFNSAKSNKKIANFLNTELYHRAIGSRYYPERKKHRNYSESKLIDSYDGLIFFSETNPSIMMKKR
jgi:erythromycin esterase